MQDWQANFARALLDRELPPPPGVSAPNSTGAPERFGVYRNNRMVSLLGALEARFPAARKIVGTEFFKAAARQFIAAHPPRSPIMIFYGDAFPEFLESFKPAQGVPYLADAARLEAARARAYHAADAKPLCREALAAVPGEALADMCFTLHPSIEILSSPHPIVTIFAMNTGTMDLAPIVDWHGEHALILRPEYEVEIRRISAGQAAFLRSLAKKNPLGEAISAALAAEANFDPANSIALLFSRLAIAMVRNGAGGVPA
ncbi:MAG: putative DNA-binding domain-containing protein [Methylocapsa sp.]|nr:putative DNA-binding domain-containing protein [Methylocapsa sp.]